MSALKQIGFEDLQQQGGPHSIYLENMELQRIQ